MTLAASHRTFFLVNVTLLALLMIRHAQPGLLSLGLHGMAVRAVLVFRTDIRNFFPVFIHMMADGTIIKPRLLIMVIMVKNTDRPFQSSKRIEIKHCIFLRKTRCARQRDAE